MKKFFLLLTILIPVSVFSQGTWELVYPNLGQWVWDLYFVNSMEGWAAEGGYTSPGNIYHTVDGGYTWDLQPDVYNEDNTGIYFLNSQIGFVGTILGSVLRTLNGGDSWDYFHINNCNTALRSFDFITNSIGYAAGGDWSASPPFERAYIVKTYNGGDTWEAIWINYQTVAYDIAFANSNDGLVACFDTEYSLFRTNDGGSVWTLSFSNDSTCLDAVEHLNDGIFIAAGQNYYANPQRPVIIRSRDFGFTWSYTNIDTIASECIQDVSFADSLHGIAVGTAGDSYYTNNGGLTWNYISVGIDELGMTICYPELCVAYTGLIFNDIYRFVIPEQVPPAEIDDLTISIQGENAVLHWNPVNEDIFGNILQNVQYSVYSEDTPYFIADSTSLYAVTSDTFFTDSAGGLTSDRFYKIIVSAINNLLEK